MHRNPLRFLPVLIVLSVGMGGVCSTAPDNRPGDGLASQRVFVARGQPVGVLSGPSELLGETEPAPDTLVVRSAPLGDNIQFAGYYTSIALLADAFLAPHDCRVEMTLGIEKINDDPSPVQLSIKVGIAYYEFAFAPEATTFKGVLLDASRYQEVGVHPDQAIVMDGSPFTLAFERAGETMKIIVNGALLHSMQVDPTGGELAIQVDRTYLYRDTNHEDVRAALSVYDWNAAGGFVEPTDAQKRWNKLAPVSRRLMKRVGNAYGYVEDDPNLPNVLLIGDSISIYYTDPVRRLLAGKADVYRTPMGPGKAESLFASLDAFLADHHFDVIHFNTGLHDLSRKEGTPEQLEDYRKNLTTIVDKLEATGATLIWASTTPIQKTVTASKSGLEVEYNRIAAGIMAERGIEIDDLHTAMVPHHEDYWAAPNNIHFNREGSAFLGEQVAASISLALDKVKPHE